MSVAHRASPSELTASDMGNRTRRYISEFTFSGNLSTSSTAALPVMLPGQARLLRAEGYRATAGAGDGASGATTANLYSKAGSADEVALLASAFSFAQADGAGLRQVRAMNSADARYNDRGIVVNGATEILYAKITAIETGATAPTNLKIVLEWELC
ncbi:MAG: hypothetical protein EKK55_12230 [Rhodocyclaceae bacterium]|nr:MAG: hypothetical protein EKK55_12230 [Rhodocyclaceae bacterium]